MLYFWKLKKGVKAGMAAVQVKNIIDDEQIVGMIQEFNSSQKRKLMIIGKDYCLANSGIVVYFQSLYHKVV